jgi:hypothetical protein
MSREFFPEYNPVSPQDIMKWIQFAVAILPMFGLAFPPLLPELLTFQSFAQAGLGVASSFLPIP